MSMSATLTRGDRARSPGPGSGSTIRLLEHFATAEPNIDRKAGVMYRVKILGRESANRRTYSDQAMRDAAQLYEGAAVHFDHDREQPNRERKTVENFGILRGPMIVVTSGPIESQGVFGNLHYLTTHTRAAEVLERIDKKMPIGLSHNADGNGRRSGERFIVESIAKVNSVDLVLNPATSKSLFESQEQGRYGGRSLAAAIRGNYRESDLGGTVADDVIDRFARMLPESHEQIAKAYEAAALELIRLEKTPGEIADCMKALAMAREHHEQEIERGAAAAAVTEPTPTLESVTRELDIRMGRIPADRPYPKDVKQMAAALRR